MRYCEASAKDNFNVDEIFLKLVDDILSKVDPECISSCPVVLNIRNDLILVMKESDHSVAFSSTSQRCCSGLSGG